jgi:hypothetical protein
VEVVQLGRGSWSHRDADLPSSAGYPVILTHTAVIEDDVAAIVVDILGEWSSAEWSVGTQVGLGLTLFQTVASPSLLGVLSSHEWQYSTTVA